MCCDHKPTKGYSINKDAKELKLLSKEELLTKWVDIFKTPAPEHLNKPYLIKYIAWQSEFGGLPAHVQKQIDKLVEQYSKTKTLKVSDFKKIQKFEVTAGTRFIREFKGKKHEVTALEKASAVRQLCASKYCVKLSASP